MKRRAGLVIFVLVLIFSLTFAGVVQAKPVTDAKSVPVKVTSAGKQYQITLPQGKKLLLSVKAGTKTIPSSEVKFASSKPEVVSVSKKGVLTVQKPGAAVILVKFRQKRARILIKVPESSEDPAHAKTIKNYLLGALVPVGKVLYVWGGGWNDSTRKGLNPQMVKWFRLQSPDYDFHDYEDLTYGSRAKGFDCSGYLGWCLYQVMHEASDVGRDYTVVSGEVGGAYQDWGFGVTFSRNRLASKYHYTLRPGIVGYKDGHCFIILGQCKDKSAVILQSTPQAGVQISGTATPSGKKKSQAVALAKKYMKKYYPDSVSKYKYKFYAGNYLPEYDYFIWNDETLSDPDGYKKMTAEEILKDLFASAQ